MTVSLELSDFSQCASRRCVIRPTCRRFAHSLTYTFTRTISFSACTLQREARARVCVGNARFVARVPTTAARPSRSLARFPSHACYLPRVSALRRHGRRPEGSSPRRAECRHGLSSHCYAASLVLPPFLPPPALPYPSTAPPTATRRVASVFFAPSSSHLLFAAIPSHMTCRRRLFAHVERRED